MTVIDRKQVIKNYVDNANEAFVNMIENIIEVIEKKEPDIHPFTPEQQKKYDIAISELDAGDGMPHEEFMAEMKKKFAS